jgi:hypothetical protein
MYMLNVAIHVFAALLWLGRMFWCSSGVVLVIAAVLLARLG